MIVRWMIPGVLLFLCVIQVHAISWTAEEAAWIAAHPVVRLGVDPFRCPIEFVDEIGRHQGISREIVEYVEKVTGIRFDTRTDLSWVEVHDALSAKRLDITASVRPTEKRKEYLLHTDPYLQIPIVIVVREGGRYVEGLQDLNGLRVAIVVGNASSEYVLRKNLKATFLEYPNYRAALRGIGKNEADAMVGNLAILTYEIQSMDVPVHIAAPTNFNAELTMGVRKDWPELVGILNKALAGLSEEQKTGMKNRWVNSNVFIGVPWSKVLEMGGLLFLFFLLVIGAILLANRRLNKEIRVRKRAEQLSRESEKNYRLLFQNMDQAFSVQQMIRDEDGQPVDYRYTELNAAYARLFGVNPEKILGKTCSEMGAFPEPDWLQTVSHVATTGEAIQLDRRIPGLDRWMQMSVFSPKKEYFACIHTDITEQRKRLVDMISQRDEMSHFIYSVSHDLKGPIITITSFVQMLEEDIAKGNTEETQKELGYIRQAANRVSVLLEGLLQVARLGKVELDIKTWSIQDLVEETAGMLAGRLRESGLSVRRIEQGAFIDADRDRMIQVFQNLIENAAKYRSSGEDPWVDVVVETRANNLVVVVRDNGKGIPQSRLTHVFDIFEKVDKQSDGAGIGLALVKRIIELHNGRIWAESSGEGSGTSFCFSLPSLRLQRKPVKDIME